ncbi:MAG: hypothetical protein OEW65_09950 [Thermoleophilia bacterium]|nr:hypothetical protein [Thermoleophilia bacterium]
MTAARALRALLGLAVAALLAAPGALGASDDLSSVSVAVERSLISTRLGDAFTFRSTITNKGADTADGLIAHLNVLSLRPGTYVDPEDWSSDRTRYLEPLPAGGSTTISWKMQAVNDGAFGVYIAVLPATGAAHPPATAPMIRLDVASRKKLNAGGLLPIALGVPALLGLLAAGARLARRG